MTSSGLRTIRDWSVASIAVLLIATAVLVTPPVRVGAQSAKGPTVVLLQVTIGASATQLTASQIQVRQLMIQNNAAHLVRVGDSTVTSSKGIYLAAGPGGGSFNSGPVNIYETFLSDWYVAGTNGDVVDVLYVK